MTEDSISQFREVLLQAGLSPGEIVPDGKIRRRGTSDRPRSDNGWFVLFADPLAGAFGDWSTGLSEKWSNGRSIDPRFWENISGEIARQKKERKAAEERKHEEAAQGAKSILEGLPHADASNPYLTRKGVKPCPGLKMDGSELVVPVLGRDKKPISLQRIAPDGTKRFLSGARVAGGFFSIRGKDDAPLYICEGVATGLSVHEATEATVICAFSAGNLKAVAQIARRKYPKRAIMVVGDNDQHTEQETGQNPGLKAANEAAKAVKAKVVEPGFNGDFNDYHQLEGIKATRELLLSVEPKTHFSAVELMARYFERIEPIIEGV